MSKSRMISLDVSAPLSFGVADGARRAPEVAAFEEFAEPRIISKGIPLGVSQQPGQVDIVGRVGAPEPREREISLAEPIGGERYVPPYALALVHASTARRFVSGVN
jgi:hypothetical protein